MQDPSGSTGDMPSSGHPFERDRVPFPTEDASEAAWREYDACCRQLDEQLGQLREYSAQQARAAIQRAALGRRVDRRAADDLAVAAPLPAAAAPHVTLHVARASGAGVEGAMQLASRHGRLCPGPMAWERLRRLLAQAGPERPPPGVPAQAWDRTPDWAKRQALREQLRWAARQGLLDRVLAFLQQLPESHWHHLEVSDWPRLDGAAAG